jgi:mono/diheme cytochrome c family protein
VRHRLIAVFAALSLCGSAVMAEEDAIARGELLFNIGGCTNCHTAKDGPVLAGGDPIRTPFGTFHAPNITPDPDTGIGAWSEADFLRAMREGIAPNGAAYYPAFPYTSYAAMPEADLKALKAYLDTIEPVAQENRPHRLAFPYNLRAGLHLWQWAFFDPVPFSPRPDRTMEWNRGAYLVNGPGHCQECHTPRGWTGALDRERAFEGSDLGEGIGRVPAITPTEQGIGDWSADDLLLFFQLGMMPDGDFAGGEMGKVVSNATAKLPDADRQAIVDYLMNPAR